MDAANLESLAHPSPVWLPEVMYHIRVINYMFECMVIWSWRRVLRDSQNSSLSMRAVCPDPVFDRFPLCLPAPCPLKTFAFLVASSAAPGLISGYGLGYVAEIEEILEYPR